MDSEAPMLWHGRLFAAANLEPTEDLWHRIFRERFPEGGNTRGCYKFK